MENKDKEVEVKTQKSSEELQKNIDILTEELNKSDADKQILFNIVMNVTNVILMETLKITESIAAMQKISREAIEAISPRQPQQQPQPLSMVSVKSPNRKK